jgi:phosphofructokinase-like protein
MSPSPAKKIAVLTGGGDCPGLNAVIRAVAKRSLYRGYEVVGLLDGWEGLLEKRSIPLHHEDVAGIVHMGGTMLGTSRTNVLKDEATIQKAFSSFREMGLHGLVAVGGEGTLHVSSKMFERGMKLVGCPKTIDNDINVTDFTVGFNTAVEIATEAIDRLRTTAESHRRVMVVEVMGRHAGWIATYAGLAGGADCVLIPEYQTSVEEILALLKKRHDRGKRFSIVVVAEGAKLKYEGKEFSISKDRKDAFGRPQLGGIGQALSNLIEDNTGIECRVTVLGHIQRGGSPTAWDRVIGLRLGSYAADLLHEEKWGTMAAFKGNDVVGIPLKDAVNNLKTVDSELWELAQSFFG